MRKTMIARIRAASGRWLMRGRALAAVAAVIVCGAQARPALAQQGPGVEVGASGGPNQFYVGANYLTTPIADGVRFRPAFEVGVGDSETLVGVNFDFVDRIQLRRTPWKLYFGGGPGLNIIRHAGVTNSGGGFDFVLGVQHPKGLFTEVKVGVLDSPSVKVGVGWTFGG
ncbi:MAG: hypothetical protein KGN76_07440 [Acidobacteriota bacterium]|nr:hypothetical protein [Acidobacteriota bacterium]